MEYREFLGEKISRLGFGTMRFSVDKKGDINEKSAEKMLDEAYKSGVNYYDTAYPYHGGKSEGMVKKALGKYERSSYYLADKLPIWLLKKQEDAGAYFDEQLIKCGVEYFDFYLLHAMGKERLKTVTTLNVMDELRSRKAAGQIRHLGMSFHDDLAGLKLILDTLGDDIEFVQLQINYYDWFENDAKELYEECEKRGLPVIVMEPVRGGALAKLVKSSRDVFSAYDENASVASYAIRFCMSLDNVMVVLSGMSSMPQVKDNLLSADKPVLCEEEYKAISDALKEYKRVAQIPCTRCKYCEGCPNGINISDLFLAYK